MTRILARRMALALALGLGLALLLALPSEVHATDPPVSAGAAGRSPMPSADAAAALIESARFKRLAEELRCMVCQNQTLGDSTAPLAVDLKNEVVRLMAGGSDDTTIKSFLVERYGEFVLYRPPMSGRNALLWLGPFLLLALGAVTWWRLGRRRPAVPRSADEALKRVDELLGR